MSIISSDRDRLTLEKELANLLDFEDAADEIPEILDNLLVSFFPTDTDCSKNPNDSCKDDLLEHMVAWLGKSGDAVRSFVDNVVRFKRGESIADESNVTGSNDGSEDEKKGKTNYNTNFYSSTQQSAGSQSNANAQARSNRQKQQDRNNQKQKEAAHKKEELRKAQQKQQQQQQQKRVEEEKRKQKQERDEQSIIIQQQQQQQQRKKELEALALANKRKIQKKKDTKPPPPQTGKATIICGCFGTKCKPLTNCLHCGRIACEKEGYGYCPFCSHIIRGVDTDTTLRQLLPNDHDGTAVPGASSMEKAILHKERLLQFDRDCAKRTVVLDDQADYFKNSSSTWLSGDERQRASEQDDRLRKDLHERKKPVMKLDILG